MDNPIQVKAGESHDSGCLTLDQILVSRHSIRTHSTPRTRKVPTYSEIPKTGGSQALDLLVAQGGFIEALPEAGTYTMVNHQFIDAERGR